MTPLIRLVSLIAAAIAFMIAVSHLLGAERGPGDGFTAGIISALGLTLLYEAFGYQAIMFRGRQIRFEAFLLIGVGLAALGALLPLIAGDNLFAPFGISIRLPAANILEITQADLFDLGIALAVFGGAMTAIAGLRTEDTTEEEGQQ